MSDPNEPKPEPQPQISQTNLKVIEDWTLASPVFFTLLSPLCHVPKDSINRWIGYLGEAVESLRRDGKMVPQIFLQIFDLGSPPTQVTLMDLENKFANLDNSDVVYLLHLLSALYSI